MRIALLSAVLLCTCVLAQDPKLAPPPSPQRPAAEIMKDWELTAEQLRAILPSPRAVTDPEKRKETAPIAIPLLRKALALNTEVYHARPEVQTQARRNHYHMLAILSFLGDAPAAKELAEAKDHNVKDVAQLGRHGWYLSQWWQAGEDEKKGDAILDELEGIAKGSPEDDDVAAILVQFRQEGCATEAQDGRIGQILARMTGPLARRATDQLKAAEKRKSFLGKPLSLASTTLAGAEFSTESLKGKYIILHFGATWCEPWLIQHNQLLQWRWPDHIAVVTILCDKKEEDVGIFVQRQKEIPWPVVRDRKDPLAFAAQYGVEVLPTTIVIGPDGKVQMVGVEPNERLLAGLLPVPSSTKPSK